MWNFINSLDFPETAEWFEEIYLDNLDDLESDSEGAVNFRFRTRINSKGEQEPVPGLQLVRNKEYKIECKPGLSIKPGDMIRFNKDQDSVYTVTDVEYTIDSRNNTEYMYTNVVWPGYAEETKILLITIK